MYNILHIKSIEESFWRCEVTEFAGEPKACEGQPLIKWVSLHELKELAIPAANHPIVQRIFKDNLIL